MIILTVLLACSNDPLVVTIEFDTRGGNALSAIQITEDDPFNLPTPVREGYDFVGWRYQNQLLEDPDVMTFIESNTFNIYLAAEWELSLPDVWTVRFINDFGNNPEPQLYEPGELVELPDLRNTESFQFSGWFIDEAREILFTGSAINQDMTLYAGFQEIKPLNVEEINLTFNDPLRVNQSVHVSVSIKPDEVENKDYRLESSDSSIIEVIDNQTLLIHDLGTVTLTAIALDTQRAFEKNIEISRYGINNQADLDAFNEKGLSIQVELIQTIERLVITHPVDLNLNGTRINTLIIESSRSGQVTLSNGTVQDELLIEAASMRVINQLNILGKTTIKQIGMTSFISEGRHNQPITLEGSGRIELSGAGSNTALEIRTSEPVVLDGRFTALVTIIAPDAKVQIDGSLQRLNVENDATITVRNNASVDEFNPGNNAVKLQLESTATVNLPTSENVSIERLQRVYVSGVSAPRGGYFSILKGSQIDFIERTPTREGHQFLGWFTDQTFETPFNFNQAIDEDITLYARWQINTYQVRFIGVTPTIPVETVNYGSRIPQPSAPPKDGYRFVGWYLDSSYQNPVNFSQRVEENITIYARYEINNFTVSFRNASLETQTISYNQRLSRPPDPERTGHRFVGWFTDSSFQNAYDFNRPITGNITLFAQFEINTYNVFFSGVNLPSVEVNFNQTLSRPANPAKEGHTFKGWFKDSSFQEPFNFSQPILGSTTVYASFEANTFRVNFNLHTSEIDIPPQTIAFSRRPALSYDLAREGYLFAGWYFDANYDERFTLSDTITANTTLHAKWIENEGNLQGVIHFMNENREPIIINQNTPIRLNAPSRTGYRFLGWFEDSQGMVPLRNQLTDIQLEVYARYEAITFNVRFEGASIDNQTVRYNQRVSVPPTPRKEGHSFVGWYQDSNFQTLFNFQSGITQNTVIYAKFQNLQHRVRFMEASTPDQMINSQETVTKPPNPTRAGHTFVGWYQDSNLTEPFNFSTPISRSTDIYAKWDVHQFTVQFVSNAEGLTIPSQTVNYNQRPSMPTNLVKDGFTFEGWYTDAAFNQSFGGGDRILSNTVLHAKWIEEVKIFIHFHNVNKAALEVLEGSSIQLEDPVPEAGFEFNGWYEDEDFTVPLRATAPDTALNVYARFDPKVYTIDFNTDHPQLSLDNVFVEHGQLIILPEVTVTGYDFVDWYLEASFDTSFDVKTEITDSFTLYGKFEIHTFDVVFHTNVEGLNLDAQMVDFNQTVTDPNLLLEAPLNWEGHTFKGWYQDEALTQWFDLDQSVNSNLDLYAKWDAITYPVRFHNEGFITEILVTHGSILSPPTVPERLGHTFEGWYLSSEFLGSQYGFNSDIVSAMTLYAKWHVNVYPVRYMESDGLTLIEEKLVTYGASLVPPAVTLNLGQQLSGWALEDDLISLSSYKMPAQGITLKAVTASTNSLLIYAELFTQTTSTVQVEIRLGGTVNINAYDILIEFNPDQLSYSNHLAEGLVHAINTSVSGQIRLNYSNIQQAITTDSMVIRIEFNRLKSGSSLIDVKMLEGYVIDNLNQIIPVEAEPIPLTINE